MTFKARINYLKPDLKPTQFNLLVALAEHPNGLKSNELLMMTGIRHRFDDIDAKVKALLKSEELTVHVTYTVLDDASPGWLWELRDIGVEL